MQKDPRAGCPVILDTAGSPLDHTVSDLTGRATPVRWSCGVVASLPNQPTDAHPLRRSVRHNAIERTSQTAPQRSSARDRVPETSPPPASVYLSPICAVHHLPPVVAVVVGARLNSIVRSAASS